VTDLPDVRSGRVLNVSLRSLLGECRNIESTFLEDMDATSRTYLLEVAKERAQRCGGRRTRARSGAVGVIRVRTVATAVGQGQLAH